MSLHSQLIATCFLVVCQLTASTIDLSATSATASWADAVNFLITGPSLVVEGNAVYLNSPVFVPTGASVVEACGLAASDDCIFPLRELVFGPLVPGCNVSGVGGFCSGTGSVDGTIPSMALVPSTPNPTITFPAVLTGGYDLCGSFSPPCPPEPLIAHINVDLPGELTLSFGVPFPPTPDGPNFEFYLFRGAQFVSTPESSTLLLTLIGSAVLALAAILRCRKPPA
jgi:hypothetical protein